MVEDKVDFDKAPGGFDKDEADENCPMPIEEVLEDNDS